MGWFSFWGNARRRRSPFNNLGPEGLTCGNVTESLYVGGELGPEDWKALAREGVTVAVNLQQEQQDTFSLTEYVDGYLWLPAPDGMAPSLQQLEMGVEFIAAAIESDKRVFVHCKAGQGRAPLLCACYLIRTEGLMPLAAVSRVRNARPRTQLTPEQNVRLREFAALYGVTPKADAQTPGGPISEQQQSAPEQETSTQNAVEENPDEEPENEPTSEQSITEAAFTETTFKEPLQQSTPVPAANKSEIKSKSAKRSKKKNKLRSTGAA